MASGRKSGRGSTLPGLSSELRVLPGVGIRLFAPRKRRRSQWYARGRGRDEKSLIKIRSCSILGRQEFCKDDFEGLSAFHGLLYPVLRVCSLRLPFPLRRAIPRRAHANYCASRFQCQRSRGICTAASWGHYKLLGSWVALKSTRLDPTPVSLGLTPVCVFT